ncbi:MAG TPA: VOC family protein [Gaiellaceae bacterium]|nr:VOC family protein [Gaiellaceae bacterium]
MSSRLDISGGSARREGRTVTLHAAFCTVALWVVVVELELGTEEIDALHAGIIVAAMADRAKLVGINHVALEVDDVDEALEFYGRVFEFSLRGRAGRMAFIDMGDQFIALAEGRTQEPDRHRHFGLVVDDLETARRALEAAGAHILPGRGLSFIDPWGNHFQVVEYGRIQFTKAPEVMRGMGLGLGKSPEALEELRAKGLLG